MRTAREEIAPVSVRFGRTRWKVRSYEALAPVQGVLLEPDAFLAGAKSILKNTSRVMVGRIQSPTAESESWVLRRINYGPTRAMVRDFFRVAAPFRAFRAGLELERAGIPTPQVLAAGVIRVFHKPVTGYLLAKDVAPAVSLAQTLQQPLELGRNIVHRVADAIARLHNSGFTHGDLTINNILLDERGQPWFVDLDRVRRGRRPASWRQAVEDFHRLARHVPGFRPSSQRAALRLLKEYCAQRGWAGKERVLVEDVFRRLRGKPAAEGMA